MRSWILAALVWLSAAGVGCAQQTQGWSTALGRVLELPAHKRLISSILAGAELAPFQTDGCSGGMTAGWSAAAELIPGFEERYRDHPPWEACCLTHDRQYHSAAGALVPEQSYAARLSADEALQTCVLKQGQDDMTALTSALKVSPETIANAYTIIAQSMFNAVRLGGGPCSGLPWRWGFGYPSCLWP